MKPYYENENGKIYLSDFVDIAYSLPAKSQQLIIADPPYYRVKGDFDFIWKDFDAYLKDVEKWAKACKHLLADNGTLFWYGSAKRIAYAQIIFDKHFNLINNIVWDKGSFMGLEESEGLRSFAPCTERILMYENADKTGSQMIKNSEYLFLGLKNYLKDEKSRSGLTLTDLNEILTGKRKSDLIAKRYFGTSQWELPTSEMYKKLQTTGFFIKEYEELRKEYEELRKEYEELRRPFNNSFKLQEVMRFKNEQVQSSKYDHDTVKPEGLTNALIITCSRKNDNVFIPFAGSGTECSVSETSRRKWIGCEVEEKHCKTTADRVIKAREQYTLDF